MPGEIDFPAYDGETTQSFCIGFDRSTFRAGVFMEAHGSLLSSMSRV